MAATEFLPCSCPNVCISVADREGERQGHSSLNFHLQVLRLAMVVSSKPYITEFSFLIGIESNGPAAVASHTLFLSL